MSVRLRTGPRSTASLPCCCRSAPHGCLGAEETPLIGTIEDERLRSAGFIAGLAVWLGTPLLFYMYVAPPFSHAASAFAVALFVTVWFHVRREWTPGGTFALGLCAALIAMIREQDVFLVLGPAFDFGLALISPNSHQRPAARGARWVVAAARWVNGLRARLPAAAARLQRAQWLPGSGAHVTRKMFWYAPHGLQVLLSPHHGFFFWTPLAVLAIGIGSCRPAEAGHYDDGG